MTYQPISQSGPASQVVASPRYAMLALDRLRHRRRWPEGTADRRIHHETARTYIRMALGIPPIKWRAMDRINGVAS